MDDGEEGPRGLVVAGGIYRIKITIEREMLTMLKKIDCVMDSC